MHREGPRARRRDLIWFALGLGLPLPWVVAEALHGLGIQAEVQAPLAGMAILGAAFVGVVLRDRRTRYSTVHGAIGAGAGRGSARVRD
jgi:hypothetical protein